MLKKKLIHVESQTKYKDGGERILRTLATNSSLFAADVGYHKSCYESFRSPKWNKEKENYEKEKDSENDTIDELLNLVEYLIIVKQEVYTLSQLREFFSQIKGVSASSLRSIDIKKLIQDKLTDKIVFCKPTIGSSNTTEYVVSADVNILPDAIRAINTGEGITSYLQLKAITR